MDATLPEALYDWRNPIFSLCFQITPKMLRNVRECFEQSLSHCMKGMMWPFLAFKKIITKVSSLFDGYLVDTFSTLTVSLF